MQFVWAQRSRSGELPETSAWSTVSPDYNLLHVSATSHASIPVCRQIKQVVRQQCEPATSGVSSDVGTLDQQKL
jgi:hypothetical protein